MLGTRIFRNWSFLLTFTLMGQRHLTSYVRYTKLKRDSGPNGLRGYTLYVLRDTVYLFRVALDLSRMYKIEFRCSVITCSA